MFLAKLRIENFRCFGEGEHCFETEFRPGLTALIGANDAGKTAIIDAIRFALGTSDQDRARIEDSDFHAATKLAHVTCRFDDLEPKNLYAFAEYLVHGAKPGDKPSLFVHWTVENTGEMRRGRSFRRMLWTWGRDGKGGEFNQDARNLLQATYLRPLRDSEAALSAGRGSRLAQVLRQSTHIKKGATFDPTKLLNEQTLSILSITKLLHELLCTQEGVKDTSKHINDTLGELALVGEDLKGVIRVSGAALPDEAQLRELLEKLDLRLTGDGRLGLGSDNLLFMACELLLLSQDSTGGNKMLLIEEPEAHLHAQRQLQVMKALQTQAMGKNIQVFVTTHSPNLSSAINVDNLVLISRRRGFTLASGKTLLDASDYRFLARFLDSTKANLFFARAVLIVEGDAESILLPTLARLIGADLTANGVSIVNVGGVGLRRYARIFRRKNPTEFGSIGIPVACITDMDVLPKCAPVILGKVKPGEQFPDKRRWKAKQDFADDAALSVHRNEKSNKTDGETVKTFVADEWTFEYDLALGARNDGAYAMELAEEVCIAVALAVADEKINAGTKTVADITAEAKIEFAALKATTVEADGSSASEVLATIIYEPLANDRVSKPITAQYLAERLNERVRLGTLDAAKLNAALPKYLVAAIEHVTKPANPAQAPS